MRPRYLLVDFFRAVWSQTNGGRRLLQPLTGLCRRPAAPTLAARAARAGRAPVNRSDWERSIVVRDPALGVLSPRTRTCVPRATDRPGRAPAQAARAGRRIRRFLQPVWEAAQREGRTSSILGDHSHSREGGGPHHRD